MLGSSISIVIPVLNERDNVQPLIGSFDGLMNVQGVAQLKEVIFVDDGSTDGTVLAIKQEIGLHPYGIRLLERSKKMGTVDAAIAGSVVAESDAVVVMDGDLQHPPHVVTELAKWMNEGHDLIIASRHVEGGNNVWRPWRGVISRGAIFVAYALVPQSRKIRDPISGFFLVDRKLITDLPPIAGRAKLLLYILSSSDVSNPLEVPYTLVDRKSGTSKVVGRNLSFITNYLIEVIGYMRNSHHSKVDSKKVRMAGSANPRE